MSFKYVAPSANVFEDRKSPQRDFDTIFKNGFPVLKMKERAEPYRIRILPPGWANSPEWDHIQPVWGLRIYVHYNIGIDTAQYLCQCTLNHAQTCFLDQEYNKFVKSGDKVSADKIKAQSASIAYVINREEEAKGPQIWRMTTMLESDIWARSIDKETKERYFIDSPDSGFDLFVTRTGSTKINTRYSAELSRHSSPLSSNPDTMNNWLDFISTKPLPSALNWYPDGYIKEVYNGQRKIGSLNSYGIQPVAPQEAATAPVASAEASEPVTGFRRPVTR